MIHQCARPSEHGAGRSLSASRRVQGVAVLVFVVHADDLVVGREEGDGHTSEESEEAPVEALLDEEKFQGEDAEKQPTDVGRPDRVLNVDNDTP